ncbi:dethiobiotin synthase [Algiphilus sp.]|uniref:dethiobiotin synthase n=1 Tax=Algiphilus sp. TaxID=1872431 RepID=UPI003BACFA8F
MSTVIAVTGTDTGVGKTRIASALLLALRDTGAQVAGYKPVASGSDSTAEGLRNEDALALLAASSPGLRYDEVNPVTFAPAIAPHIAAQREGRPIPLQTLDDGLEALRARHEWVVVEGAGGWRVPLTDRVDFADWVAGHRLPTLLVVGIRLGAINHSLLTAEPLKAAGLWLGWVGNILPEEDTGTANEMLQTLQARLGTPLGVMACGEAPEALAQRLDVEGLAQACTALQG